MLLNLHAINEHWVPCAERVTVRVAHPTKIRRIATIEIVFIRVFLLVVMFQGTAFAQIKIKATYDASSFMDVSFSQMVEKER
jgi:hypothetical protein